MLAKPLYQLVLLGARRHALESGLIELLMLRLDEIGEGTAEALCILGPADFGQLDPTAPSVVTYFGDDTHTDKSAVQTLYSKSIPILPVVDDLNHFSKKVSDALRPLNGIELSSQDPDFTEIVNLILENLALLRSARRMFLSYKRDESTPVAQQLRIAFDAAGYDAFLDTNSVQKGDDFQQVLFHRLLDSDVLVVLDTPSFLTSKYTRMELAHASAMSVGMLHLIWPDVTRAPHALLAEPFYLVDGDFLGRELTDDTVKRVTTATEALRARCIAARHANLVVEFCREAQKIGAKTEVQPERYVLAELPDKRRVAAIPAVGVPDARRYHDASKRFPGANSSVDEAVLIYDHRGMQPAWQSFLDWLDDFLPIKGLRVTDTAARLGT